MMKENPIGLYVHVPFCDGKCPYCDFYSLRGTEAVSYTHLDVYKRQGLEGLRPTAVVSPGVLGTTGVEVSELLHALTKELKPAAIIAIDALAARSLKRLGCTIQLSDAGIAPGSGIGNARPGLSAETLGIPVIGLGIPTVVDALTMANDLLGMDTQNQEAERMVVTPREIDLMISRGARMLAMAVNVALNPSFTVEEFSMLV